MGVWWTWRRGGPLGVWDVWPNATPHYVHVELGLYWFAESLIFFFLVGFGLLQGFPVIDSVHTFYGQNIDLLPKVEEFKYLRFLFTSVGRVECETVGWIGVAV